MPSSPKLPEKGAVNVAAYEFPLWVAASFSTVAEVRKALKDVVIVAKAPSEGLWRGPAALAGRRWEGVHRH